MKSDQFPNAFRNSLWTIGIKLFKRKHSLSLAVVSVNRQPFVGSLKYLTHRVMFLPRNTDVIPQTMMFQLMSNVLEQHFNDIHNSYEENLPANLMILRSGISDTSFATIMKQEISAIKQVIQSFEQKKIRWFPCFTYSVIQHNQYVIDAFMNSSEQDIERAFVITDSITSTKFADFYLSIPFKQLNGKTIPQIYRVIILFDEYNNKLSPTTKPLSTSSTSYKFAVTKNENLLSLYIDAIYCLFWGYSFAVPFATLPNLPSPLKYAEHYGKWRYSTLSVHDQSLRSIETDIENSKPKIFQCK